MEKRRYHIIDRIRGMVLISMILYHAAWNMVYLFGADWKWYHTPLARVWQQSICWSFILLSGFCWSMGKNKWKRGCMVFGAGVVISLATAFFMPGAIILFGVLTLLGSCMLLMIPLQRGLQHIPSVMGLFLFGAAFVVTRNINQGFLGFESWNWLELPKELYVNLFTTYLGFMKPGFFSTDYFSLFPWLFLYIAGYYVYRLFEEKGWLSAMNGKSYCYMIPLEWLGRKALLIYILHQPILYGVQYVLHQFGD